MDLLVIVAFAVVAGFTFGVMFGAWMQERHTRRVIKEWENENWDIDEGLVDSGWRIVIRSSECGIRN